MSRYLGKFRLAANVRVCESRKAQLSSPKILDSACSSRLENCSNEDFNQLCL